MSASFTTTRPSDARPNRALGVLCFLKSLRRELLFFESTTIICWLLSCCLAILMTAGLIDYWWDLSYTPRLVLLSFIGICLGGGFLFVLWKILKRPSLVQMAIRIERKFDQSRNAITTLSELIDAPIPEYIRNGLERQALNEISNIKRDEVVLRQPAFFAFLLTGALVCTLGLFYIFNSGGVIGAAQRVILLARDTPAWLDMAANSATYFTTNLIELHAVTIHVTPPSYSGLKGYLIPQSSDSIRVPTGSRIDFDIETRGQEVALQAISGGSIIFGGSVTDLRRVNTATYSGSFLCHQTGIVEIRLIGDEGKIKLPSPFIRAVEAIPDTPPEIILIAPSGDQLLADVPDRAVLSSWKARDDLGLKSVKLQYVMSRGEGDAAKFTNGEVAGVIKQGKNNEYTGSIPIDIRKVGLQSGDTLIFWIEAQDTNPTGAGIGRTTSAVIAIRGPELARIALGDMGAIELGKTLLSERQIIIHTERLHGEQAKLSRDEFIKRANEIAVEQRDFRESFTSLISKEGPGAHDDHRGESAGDEKSASDDIEQAVREAEDTRTEVHNHGIPAPPQGSPESVREFYAALNDMWDAEGALSEGSTAKALKIEQSAVEHLKKAQAAIRYVPPVFAHTTPVDLKRRYEGELKEIKTRIEQIAKISEKREANRHDALLQRALMEIHEALQTLMISIDKGAGDERSKALVIARANIKSAADELIAAGNAGAESKIVATNASELRNLIGELEQIPSETGARDFSQRLSGGLELLSRVASNVSSIIESSTRADFNRLEQQLLMPSDSSHAADYFRRLSKSASDN